MAHYLPPAIMRFFQPRESVEFKSVPTKRKMPPYHGVAQFVQSLKDYDHPVSEKKETPAERVAKRRKKQKAQAAARLKIHTAKWDPKDPEKQSTKTADAYKTLFVARLAYDVSEEDLKYEFEYYGSVVKACVVQDKRKSLWLCLC